MKTYYPITCPGCGRLDWFESELELHSLGINCTACGYSFDSPLPLSVTLGWRTHYRAQYEHHRSRDFSLAMTLAAMAVDSALSQAHIKWTEIDGLMAYRTISDADLETELRNFRTVAAKMDAVARLLTQLEFDAFLAARPDIERAARSRHADLATSSFRDAVVRTVFWPRNRILHLGRTDQVSEAISVRSLNVAEATLRVLDEMDLERRKTL